MKNTNKTNINKFMITATLIGCALMVAGAVIASRLGASSKAIAIGICLVMCLGAGAGMPIIMASAKKNTDNKDKK